MVWFLKKLPKIRATTFYVFIAPLLIFGLAAAFPGCKSREVDRSAELEFWGVFDDSDVYEELLGDFNKAYPKIKVNYYKKQHSTYEKNLLEAMAAGRGPDIMMLHHTWVPRYEDKIWSAPQDLISIRNVQDNFVDVVFDDFVVDGSIVALPLSVDSLALYYNKDIFNTAGISQPPETWEDFLDVVDKITFRSHKSDIIRAGAAIGTARNINRSTDILSLLILQSGAQMVNEEKTAVTFNQNIAVDGEDFNPGETALRFYTDFANPQKSAYTWNDRMYYSIDAFYAGETAIMFNYSYHLPTIRALAPYLNFGVSPMPQIKDSARDVNYANYWGLAVSRNSSEAETAWRFIVWLANKENAEKYLELTKKPTARRDLVSWQKNDPDLGVFAEQSLTARSWYQADNLAIETIMADMIESTVSGGATIKEAISRAVNQINILMSGD